ncbi:hypothetical protein LCGC14_1599590 [marine sediment metagenome]|uniref:Uncharacterized protein n=1 Tax=marine sediment metagenome TaxID=412755 RepID=A0A0F9KS85_9ZZZZ
MATCNRIVPQGGLNGPGYCLMVTLKSLLAPQAPSPTARATVQMVDV